jgi:hypothetical protein
MKEEKERVKELIEKFDFSVLFKDEEKSSLLQFVPLISLVLEIVILILLLIKKP